MLLLLPSAVWGQEALVLSGGGARGLAHAGVFEGLEELGYDPDIVVGTSMGGLVGALYAAGYSAEEIRDRILATNWNEVFAATPIVVGPDREVRYPMLNIDLDIDQFRAARGLVGQWRINRTLARLLFDANARARGDFDRLPRRYRAVAADLTTGETVVLAEGDLARAARASMAVPGVFAPVVWGDRVLVDGGITNNVPTDIARRLGAQEVIAVDVSRPPDEIASMAPLAVLGRAVDIMQENTQRDTVPPDVLILPELAPGLTAAAFPADPRPLFAAGLDAARRDLPPEPDDYVPPARTPREPPDSLYGLVIEAPDSSLAVLARRIFADVVPGPYDAAAVLDGMDRLYDTGLFEAVWPRVVENPDTGLAAPVLLVRLDAPPELGLAASAGYENDRGARAWASLDSYTRIAGRPTVRTLAASMNGMERSLSVAGRIYPLATPAIAWSAGAYARERDVRIFLDDALRNYDVRRFGGWAGVELPHVVSQRVATATLVGEWIYDQEGETGYSVGPALRVSSLNPSPLIVGTPFVAEAEVRFGDIAYSSFGVRGSRTFLVAPLRLAGIADARYTSSGAPGDVQPALGDAHLIPGLQWGEVRGTSRVVFGVDAAYPVMSIFLRLKLRTGAVANRVRDLDTSRWAEGAQIGFVWQTPLVTLDWGFGVNTLGDKRFDFNIGRSF